MENLYFTQNIFSDFQRRRKASCLSLAFLSHNRIRGIVIPFITSSASAYSLLGLNYPSPSIVLTITCICIHIHLLPQTKSPLGATMESILCLQDLTQYLEHSWCSYFSPQDENKYSHSSLLPHGFLAKSYIRNSSEMGNKLRACLMTCKHHKTPQRRPLLIKDGGDQDFRAESALFCLFSPIQNGCVYRASTKPIYPSSCVGKDGQLAPHAQEWAQSQAQRE